MNKFRLLTSVTLICIATLLIAIATAKALTHEQEVAKDTCGLKLANCITFTCAKYKGNELGQARCCEGCSDRYIKCLDNARLPH